MLDKLAFQPIKLKSPPGISPSFPSEISSLEAAKDFVNAHLMRRSEMYCAGTW
jgi:hypothetical protein